MDDFLKTITAKQLKTWQNYFAVYGFSQERSDYRMGVNTSMFSNVYRDKEIKPEPFVPNDFIPKFGKQNKKQIEEDDSPEKIMMKLNLLFQKGG